MGLRSTSITGGRPSDTHISSKILSVWLSVAVSKHRFREQTSCARSLLATHPVAYLGDDRVCLDLRTRRKS